MTKRKNLSKRKRFEIFKRDGFTCQYCGSQPPNVVLVIDHIEPVSKGGSNDEMNLISSCEACNQGKSDKLLQNIHPQPDADLEWLQLQQEIAELRRFQLAKKTKDKLILSIIENLHATWVEYSGEHWEDERDTIRKMLVNSSPEIVEEVLINVGNKVSGKYVSRYEWKQYAFGMLRNIRNER